MGFNSGFKGLKLQFSGEHFSVSRFYTHSYMSYLLSHL